jgi:hypothetical protein
MLPYASVCQFCRLNLKDRVVAELGSVFAVADRHPNGDTPNPRGGVRGVIPDKMNYPP